jgi:cell wall-associated NlpC family hydrolase
MNLSTTTEYLCEQNLNLYSSSACKGLATQAATHRHLRPLSLTPENNAIPIRLCEDDYPAWLNLEDVKYLSPTTDIYQPKAVHREEIAANIPAIIAFTHAAMAVKNEYLWGGTVAPNYDCSGLMQAAFGSQGIWLPRDSYQQEAFTHHLPIAEMWLSILEIYATSTVPGCKWVETASASIF